MLMGYSVASVIARNTHSEISKDATKKPPIDKNRDRFIFRHNSSHKVNINQGLETQLSTIQSRGTTISGNLLHVPEAHDKNYLDHVYGVSNDNTNAIEYYRYNAYGEVQIYSVSGTLRTSTQIDNHITWNTRRQDSLTGFHMYKFRHYIAPLGRWAGRDPIEEDGGVNLYGFCNNNSIGNWDVLGLKISSKCPLNKYFDKLKIKYDPPKKEGGYFVYSRTQAVWKKSGTKVEILTAMLKTSHVYKLKDANTEKECENYLESHVTARLKTVEAATKSMKGIPFGWSNWGNWFIMHNGAVYHNFRQGITYEDAMKTFKEHMNKSPLGCRSYVNLAIMLGNFEAGSKVASYYRRPKADSDSDWVPGDYSFLDNTSIGDDQPAITGEFLMYIGNGKFKGHMPKNNKTIQTKDEWVATVDGWSHPPKDAKFESYRTSTGMGLQ